MNKLSKTSNKKEKKSETGGTAFISKPWVGLWQKIAEEFDVSIDRGLSVNEVKKRLKKYGPNRLREAKRKSGWLILAQQFKSFMVLLLVIAACLSFVFGDWVEGVAIGVVILINAAIGFVTEIRAVRSMEALQKMGVVNTKVRRDGEIKEIPAQEIVPGDIVVFEGGDIVTADLRLFKASKLLADESTLTGESLPVSKNAEPLEEEVPLAERINILFKGTAVTRGAGEGIVVSTGMNTELGKISSLVEEAEEEVTPLEKRLDKLGHKLIWVTLVIVVFVALSGIFAGKEIFLMIETAIALAVATIPEGLPIVTTIALARGMWRMARRNTLINRLAAVETLGETSVICTDKTGTLTENRLTIRQISLESGEVQISGEGLETKGEFIKNGETFEPSDDQILKKLLEVGMLCNNASLNDESNGNIKVVGEPLEVALLVAGSKAGIDHKTLFKNMQEVREEAFDSDIKMMATFHSENNSKTGKEADSYLVAVKGAPESVLEACSQILTENGEKNISNEERSLLLEKNNRMAEQGLRILALATKKVNSPDVNPYENLTFLGLVGMLDPPRQDVRDSIGLCKKAGIRVIMVTGDQPITAQNIGKEVGLIEEVKVEVIHGNEIKSPDDLSPEERQRLLKSSIFARVSPKQKLDLISLHQKNGSIVAMTGDGVNDAPALKKADIGVAMGQRGTQVAREAADMVLKDDAFSTIVAAVEKGRVIFNNIRKFVLYLLSCNVSEVMIVALASLVNAPLPILPLQILFLNLVTDIFPALALGVGKGDAGIMKYPPRDPGEPILTRRHWLAISGYGLAITASVLGVFAIGFTWLHMDTGQAVTVSFLTLAFTQLWHVFNMRESGSGFIRNDITRNSFVWLALALCFGLLLAAVYLPGISAVLKMVPPDKMGWLIMIIMSLVPLAIGQVLNSMIFKSKKKLSTQKWG